MSIYLSDEQISLFKKNGIDESQIQNTVNSYRQEGISDEEINSKIQTKLKSFSEEKGVISKTVDFAKRTGEEVVREVKNPLLAATALGTSFARSATMGYLDKAIAEVHAARRATQSVGEAIKAKSTEPLKEGLNVVKTYKEGQDFVKKFGEYFASNYPASQTVGDLAGMLVGFGKAGVVGKAAKAGVTKGAVKFLGEEALKKKGVKALSKLAENVGTWTTYETLTAANTGDDVTQAAKKGGVMGAALTIVGGGAGLITSKAAAMTGVTGGLAKAGAFGLEAGLEGATMVAAPSVIEGEGLPQNPGDYLKSIATVGLLKGANIGASKLTVKAGEKSKGLTEQEVQETKEKFATKEEIEKRNKEIVEAKQSLEDVSKRQEELQNQKVEEQKKLDELKNEEKVLKKLHSELVAEGKNTDEARRYLKKLDDNAREQEKIIKNISDREEDIKEIQKKKDELLELQKKLEKGKANIKDAASEKPSGEFENEGLRKSIQEAREAEREQNKKDLKQAKQERESMSFTREEKGENTFLKDLRKRGVDYDSFDEPERDALRRRGVPNVKDGLKRDGLGAFAEENGYVDPLYGGEDYSGTDTRQTKAQEMFDKSLDGENVYPLGSELSLKEQSIEYQKQQMGIEAYEKQLAEARKKVADLNRKVKTGATPETNKQIREEINAYESQIKELENKIKKEQQKISIREGINKKRAEQLEQKKAEGKRIEEDKALFEKYTGQKSIESYDEARGILADLNYQKNEVNEQIKENKKNQMLTKGDKKTIIQQEKELRDKRADLNKTIEYVEAEKNKLIGAKEITEEDIASTPKEVRKLSKKEGITEEAADNLIRQHKFNEKRQKFLDKTNRENLSVGEKIKRNIRDAAEKVKTTFNLFRPFGKTAENYEQVTGKKVALTDNPEYIMNKGIRMGELESRQAPAVEKLSELKKADEAEGRKTFMPRLDNYLLDKKLIENFESKGLENLTKEQLQRLEIAREHVRAVEYGSTLSDGTKVGPDTRVLEAAKEVWNEAQATLDSLYKSKRISKERYEELKKRKHYTPSKAMDSIITEGEISEIDRSLNDSQKLFSGSALNYESPTYETFAQGRRAYRLEYTNAAKEAYLKISPDAYETDKTLNLKGSFKGDIPKIDSEYEILVWRDGEPHVYNVPNEIAKAFNYVPGKESRWETPFRAINNVFKTSTTGLSQVFAVKNLARDLDSVLAGSRASEYTTQEKISEARRMFLGIKGEAPLTKSEKSMKDLFLKQIGGEGTLAETEVEGVSKKSVEEVGYLLESSSMDSYPGAKTVVDVVSEGIMNLAKKFNVSKKWGKFLEYASYIGNGSEKMTRFVVFDNELEKMAYDKYGGKKTYDIWKENPNSIPKDVLAQATKESYETTLNFSRKMHPGIEWLNKYIIPYFKPGILGAERFWTVMTNKETAYKSMEYMRRKGMMRSLIALNYDEERKKELNRINDEMEAKNVTYIDRKTGRQWMIPQSQEYAAITKMYEVATTAIMKTLSGSDREEMKEQMFKDMKAASRVFFENNVPILGGFSSGDITPQAIKPLAEIWLNKDFFTKNPIESSRMQSLPRELRKSPNTARAYVFLSDYLHLSPVQTKKLFEGYLGSSVKELALFSDSFMDLSPSNKLKIEKALEDNFVLRSIMNNPNSSYAQNIIDLNDELQSAKEAYGKSKAKPHLMTNEEKKLAGLYKNLLFYTKKLDGIATSNLKLQQKLENDGERLNIMLAKGKITRKEHTRMSNDLKINATNKWVRNQEERNVLIDLLLAKTKKKKKELGIK